MLALLNSNLMPTWFHFASQKSTHIHENVDPKRVPIMHPFSLRFWIPKTSFLGPNLEPSWPSVSLQDGPRSLPEPHLRACFFYLRAFLFLFTRLRPSVSLLDDPRCLPDPPKRPPRSNLEPSWLSNSLQDGPRSLPYAPKRPPRPLRRCIFGRLLVDFC